MISPRTAFTGRWRNLLGIAVFDVHGIILIPPLPKRSFFLLRLQNFFDSEKWRFLCTQGMIRKHKGCDMLSRLVKGERSVSMLVKIS